MSHRPLARWARLSPAKGSARVVVERADGEALNGDDLEIIANTLAAIDDRDRTAEREYRLLGFDGGLHFAHLPPAEHADAAE